MNSVYLTSAVRTPIGKFGGGLSSLTAVELGVVATREAIARSGVALEEVDEVIVGHARQAGNGPNPARQIGWRSGIPDSVPAYTVNQACASGLKAILLGSSEIALGQAHVVLAGGTESMSRVPYLIDGARWGLRMGHHELTDAMYRDGFHCPMAEMLMGETAEFLARRGQITRSEQDAYALESQRRAADAQKKGRFDDEIIPVAPTSHGRAKAPTAKTVERDEHIRPDVTMAGLEQLPPVFSPDGTVTAGNASGITDGAAAIVIASADAVSRHGLKPLARVVDYATAGVDPKAMGIGPVIAVNQLLERTGMSLDDFDLVELNEAFAAQVLAVLAELPVDPARLNVNGGAIALGHPIGCTGTRIVVTLVHEMRKRNARYGLATLCVSGGMGVALALERA